MAKEKTDNKKLIIWALIALVVGVVIGLLLTNLTTTGNAKGISSNAQDINPDVVPTTTDLVLNLLKVNRISSVQPDVTMIEIDDWLNVSAGLNVSNGSFNVGSYNNQAAFLVTSDYQTNGPGTSTILIAAPTKFTNLAQGNATDLNGTAAYACLTADGTLFRSETACN